MRPLTGILFVSPIDKGRIVTAQNATNQLTLVLPFTELQGCQDLLLQLILSHGPVGSWPPYTYVVFKNSEFRL